MKLPPLVSQNQLWRLFFTREKSVFPSPNVGLAPQGRQQRWKLMAKGASRKPELPDYTVRDFAR